jgi:hypothetical protein
MSGNVLWEGTAVETSRLLNLSYIYRKTEQGGGAKHSVITLSQKTALGVSLSLTETY